MSDDWEFLPLGNVCQLEKAKNENLPLPYIGMEDIEAGGKGGFSGSCSPKAVKSSTFKFDETHLLYGRLRPYLNKVLMPNFAGHCSTEIFPIKPKSNLDKSFLFYWFIQQETVELIDATCTGARMPRANLKDVLKFTFPLPPLEEQKRIVAVLDAAFEGLDRARAHTEANLQNARNLKISYLQREFELFTAKSKAEVTLPELCISLHQGLNTAAEKVKFEDEGHAIIQTRNIQRGEIDLENKIKYMSTGDWDKYRDRYSPKRGDVFFTNIGTIGKTAVLSEDADYLIHWNIFKISPALEKLDPNFLKLRLDYLTDSGFFQKKQKGGTVSFVTKKMMQQVLLPVASLEKQRKFVFRVLNGLTKIRSTEMLYDSKLTNLDDLRQSLLQKAFAGELT